MAPDPWFILPQQVAQGRPCCLKTEQIRERTRWHRLSRVVTGALQVSTFAYGKVCTHNERDKSEQNGILWGVNLQSCNVSALPTCLSGIQIGTFRMCCIHKNPYPCRHTRSASSLSLAGSIASHATRA